MFKERHQSQGWSDPVARRDLRLLWTSTLDCSWETSRHDARILGSPDGAGSYNTTC